MIILYLMSSQEKFHLILSCFDSPKLPFKIAEPPLSGREKKIFKVWVVGTLNLYLKVPKKMQKTRNQFDHPRLRKRPKTVKNRPN